ncbi:MAG TPA: nitronate monooxygenase [Candidatus Deferrimicrobium sp.]|nr:nitronate monooxygenase [Candidatus Deferrimicrobium sp.]
MKLKELHIGDLVARIPIIQGGMAVRLSMAPLAAAVANEGGIGLIAGSGLSVEELRAEIRKAREMTKGIIGVNIMFAVREFADLMRAAIEEKVDLLVSGAGFSRDMFSWGKEAGIPVVPIVSTAKLARLAEKLGASAVIVEGKEAGGHLGTQESMRTILPEVKASIQIPVIGAGGVVDGADVVEIIKLGADGVQMGTRFAASEECSASLAFKEHLVQAGDEDIVLVDSPVGLPGRSVRNVFTQRLEAGEDMRPKKCDLCLKHCARNFCIMEALNKSQQGDLNNGLVFSGERVKKIKEILPVKKIFENLLKEIEKLN